MDHASNHGVRILVFRPTSRNSGSTQRNAERNSRRSGVSCRFGIKMKFGRGGDNISVKFCLRSLTGMQALNDTAAPPSARQPYGL